MAINLPLGRQGDHGTAIRGTHHSPGSRRSGEQGLSGATPTDKRVLKRFSSGYKELCELSQTGRLAQG